MSKVALITGASGGIGSVISEELYSKDYALSLLDINIEQDDTALRLRQKCDITNPLQVDKAVSRTIEKFGTIDVVVNCAGRSHLGAVEEASLEDLDSVYNINVKGTFNISKAVLPVMKQQKSGYIINIGSLRGIECAQGKAVYSMSKFAVRAFSKTLKKEVEEFGIKVTVINPGFVQTNLIRHRIREENLKPSDLTQPEDIAKSITYLLDLSEGACIEELNIGRLWSP